MDRVGDLEVDEDLTWQRREWRVEVVGRAVLALVVVAGLLGFVGHGPLSWSSASSDGGDLTVSYERFGRRGGTQAVVVRSPADGVSGDRWEIDVERSYLAAFQIEAITPQPDQTEMVDGAIRYTFVPPQRGGAEVRFDVTPKGLWGVEGTIRLVGSDEAVDLHQFYFP